MDINNRLEREDRLDQISALYGIPRSGIAAMSFETQMRLIVLDEKGVLATMLGPARLNMLGLDLLSNE